MFALALSLPTGVALASESPSSSENVEEEASNSTNLRLVATEHEPPGDTGPEHIAPDPHRTTHPNDRALRIEIEPSIIDADLLRGWIHERHPDIGERLAKSSSNEDWIEVEIAGASYDYQVTVVAMREGSPVGDVPEVLTCECSNENLLDELDAAITQAIVQLETKPEPEEPESKQEPEPEPVRPPPPDPCREKAPCWTKLGIIGVASLAVGGTSTLGGLVMVVVGTREIPDRTAFDRNWRPPGYIALGVGVAALAAGTAMFLIDRRRCRRDPIGHECTSPGSKETDAVGSTVTLRPWASRSSAGAMIEGRF